MYSEYEELLNCDFSVDYWADVEILDAITLLQKFDETDWVKLKEACLKKNEEWQIRCAETLSESDPCAVSAILESLLDQPSVAVRVAAADSINSFCQHYGDNILDMFDKDKIKKLECLYNSLGKVDGFVIKALLSRLD